MANIKQNYKGSEKLVDSSNLYENLKNFDDRRQKKLDKELRKKVTIPEHYALCKSSTPNALKIVETVSDSLTEITLADVQSKVLPSDYHSYKLNEYVVLVAKEVNKEVTIYVPRDEVYTKTEIDEKLGQNAGAITEDIKVYGVEDILGITDNTIIPQDTSYMDMFKKIFQRVIHPTYVEPTMTLVSNVKLVEKGVATNITLTPTFTKNDAGAINGYKVYRDGGVIENQTATTANAYTDSGNVFNASTVYKYEIAYNAGADKANNVGDLDPVGKIEAGSIFETVTIKPVNPTYIGIVANGTVIDESVATGLTKLITEATTYDYKATANFEDMVLVSERPLRSVINQNNYSILDSFTTQSLAIGSVTYNVYILPNINVTNFNYKFNF